MCKIVNWENYGQSPDQKRRHHLYNAKIQQKVVGMYLEDAQLDSGPQNRCPELDLSWFLSVSAGSSGVVSQLFDCFLQNSS
jgi:hypothetical protein